MTIAFGEVPVGSVLPVYFTSYDANGASVTLTGLAITDVEIYKGISITQRASDAGIVLIDTDGIDVDAVTGFHGFSIDLGDNTDAGFYAAGSFYTVLVSAVTIAAQTVNFIAATFRIKAAETLAGTAKADITHILGTAISTPATAGILDVNVKNIDNDAAVASGAVTFPNATLASTTNITGGTITTATNVTTVNGLAASVITAASIAADAITDAKVAADVTIASVTGAVGSVTGAVGSVTGLTAATVHADLDDIQARLPAALVGGRIDASVGAMAANTLTASALAADATTEITDATKTALGITTGTADSGTTTTMVDAALTQADTDYWKGSIIVSTSGTNSGQARLITGFNAATDTITFAPALTQAFGTNTYIIIPAGRADVELWDGAAVNALISGRVDADLSATASIFPTAVWGAVMSAHRDAGSFGAGAQVIRAGFTAQAGAAGTITLDASASAVDNFYNNTIITLIGGTGAGQSRIISGYVGATKVATVNGNWVTTPDATSEFGILPFGAIPGATAPTAAEVSTAVWDRDATAHQTQGTFGQAIGDPVADTNTIYKAVVTDATGATVGVDIVAVQADTDNIQTRIPAALVGGRMDASVGAVAADAITAAAIANGAIDAATFAVGAIDAAALAADAGTEIGTAVWATTARILTAGTNIALAKGVGVTGFTDIDAAGVRVAVGLATANLDTQLAAIDDFIDTEIAAILAAVDTEIATIVTSTGTTIPAQIAALNNLSAAQVKTQVVDALNVDTYAEPGQGSPAATASIATKIGQLAKLARNKKTQTATTFSLFNDAETVVDQKSTVSDDGTTTTRGELVTGP